jgi:hypothetical protein
LIGTISTFHKYTKGIIIIYSIPIIIHIISINLINNVIYIPINIKYRYWK